MLCSILSVHVWYVPVSLWELALQRWQPFCYQKLHSSPWREKRKGPSKEPKDTLHGSAFFMKEVFWRCQLTSIFFCILCSLLYLKISIFLTPFNISLLLCCYPVNAVCYNLAKKMWMLCRKTTSSSRANDYPWNYTDFIQIENMAKSGFRCFSWH